MAKKKLKICKVGVNEVYRQDLLLHISFTFVAHWLKCFSLEDAATLEAKRKHTWMQITEGWTVIHAGPVIPSGPEQSTAPQGNSCEISYRNIIFGNSVMCTNLIKYTGLPDIADRILQIVCIILASILTNLQQIILTYRRDVWLTCTVILSPKMPSSSSVTIKDLNLESTFQHKSQVTEFWKIKMQPCHSIPMMIFIWKIILEIDQHPWLYGWMNR